ncbi:PREDICTED: UDP-glucuronosyltransferase 2B20-like [Rhagoletis zephyria]|uniref:UDP-glucuronosyltransferase 2B20-like n=1 Tax=Rhagoletis zephyria TaxID=28612 RepID=UPI000811795B|nr:PREDICTED: UDP-glucuronosyltransferase 2B20-like [Rhagoletis zephyria]
MVVALPPHSKLLFRLLALAVLVAQAPTIDGARILAVYAHPASSHYQMHRVLISELVKHGHQVTMITAFTLEPLKLGSNYTEILIEPVYDYWKLLNKNSDTSTVYEMKNDALSIFKMVEMMALETTEHALKQRKVQSIINATKTDGVYDLLLVEQLHQEAFLALAHIYKVPVVSSLTFAKQLYMSQMFGIISPWSYIPHGLLPLTERMNFWERVYNTYNSYISLHNDFHLEFSYFPKMDALVKKYFGHLPILFPSISEMNRNLSATFINNYTPLASATPTMDNIINVGGLHINHPKPLPADLQMFLDDAEQGVIYFSFGTQVHAKDMPLEKLNIFIEVFRQLKQRVLWKFENASIPNLPANLMTRDWLPQNDILAHPNVRAFISHGGLFGTQEAVYHGVPVLGIPFLFDQHLNLKKAEFGGYAVVLDFHTLTRESLKRGLEQLLFNATYRDTSKRFSRIFRDRPMGPRETLLYWIDYVIRHNGARHLRAAGMDLKWYQFYLLDVAALVVAVVAVAGGLVNFTIRWVIRRLNKWGSKQKVQ